MRARDLHLCNGAIRAVFWGLAKSDFKSNSYRSSFSYCAAFYEGPDMLLVKSRFWRFAHVAQANRSFHVKADFAENKPSSVLDKLNVADAHCLKAVQIQGFAP